MDIFNRPPSISEDTIHYSIYPSRDSSDKASATALAAFISNHVDTILPDMVWHRDAFEVKIVPDQDNTGSWILEGRMRVGDCVDDEWCTVWILREISSKLDVAISVYDSDGEFLLIEAAEELPSWVKPTNSENRVWIYNFRIHLIPLSYVSPESRKKSRRKLPGATDSDDEGNDPEAFIAVEDAVQLVRDPSVDTLAPSGVEKIIWQRVSGYPASVKSHVHVAKAHLPIDIVKALSVYPSLVQKAVEAFYTRDVIQLRAAHRMSRFSPTTCVLTSVKLTRTAYAQLVGQKFFPPKVFGQWKVVEGTPEWRWRDVGMKIAVGFEMLYQESKGRPNSQNVSAEGIKFSVDANKEALRRNPEYQKYLKSLLSVDYFKGELEGSELWNEFENKAAITFVKVRRTDDATRQSFASQVDQGLASIQHWPVLLVQEEDSDDWLTIDAQEFHQSLEVTSAETRGDERGFGAMDVDTPSETESPEDRLASEQAKRLKDLATKVENFVEGEGELEGARFEDDDFSDESFSDDEESSDSEQDEDAKLAAKKAAMDSLVPALEPSEYGQMPATYRSNSQRVTPMMVATDASDEGQKKSAEETETNAEVRPVRPLIIPRDKYDGVDSDDETDEEDLDDESEEDRPQVVGDIEIDMEEEEEEFLEFSRQALGISDEQWQEIVKDRKGRGAFLPHSATNGSPPTVRTDKAEKKTHIPRVPESGPRPNVNPELDSFEAVMKALDEELLRSKSKKPSVQPSSRKGKEIAKEDSNAMVVEESDIDIEAAMDAELKEALQDAESDSEEPMDYNMIKNFLESYKSQAGLSGPVSNLAGRLQPGMKLPRDYA